MRTFVLYSRKGKTSDFNVNDLVNEGRMDLVCRCITSALWMSHDVRDDSQIFVVLNGPPNPPVTVCIQASKEMNFFADEKSTALLLKKLLSENFDKEWKIIKKELGKGKTLPSPMPVRLIRKRELLLIAQCLLAHYEYEKSTEKKLFLSELYRRTLATYYAYQA